VQIRVGRTIAAIDAPGRLHRQLQLGAGKSAMSRPFWRRHGCIGRGGPGHGR
jgi:hypothetical protein